MLYTKKQRVHTQSVTLPKHATVFQAEIQAIYEASQYLIANSDEMGIRYVKILSDSQAAITALSNTRIQSKCVLNALEAMESAVIKVKSLNLNWVKAHVNIEDNEEADKATKEGAQGGQTINTVNVPIPWSEVKNKINTYINTMWKMRWETDQRFKATKEFYDSPDKNKSKGVMRMSTYSLKAWVECITGHNNLIPKSTLPAHYARLQTRHFYT